MPQRLEQTLLGDIGATNAKFSLLTGGALGPIANFEVARYAQFPDVVAAFLDEHRGQMQVTRALFAVAGPVEGGRSRLTNCPWIIDGDELRDTFGLAKVRVVNDFAATAYSLPGLTAGDLYAIGGGLRYPAPPWRCSDPGPGLGSLALCRAPRNRWSSRVKAVMPPSRPPPSTRMPSSTICAASSGISRPSAWFPAPGWKISIGRSRRWPKTRSPRARPPRSPRSRSTAAAGPRWRRSTCSAPSWVPSPAMSR